MRHAQLTDWNQIPIIFDLPLASRLLAQSVDSLKKTGATRRIAWRVQMRRALASRQKRIAAIH